MDIEIEDSMSTTLKAEAEFRNNVLPGIRVRGEEALRRLLPIAQGDSGQCRHVASFLLGLYNGFRFKFDLTDLRCLDRGIFNDCIAVLQMDGDLLKEVHEYFENGSEIWEDLAVRWNIPDRVKLKNLLSEATFTGTNAAALRQEAKQYIDSTTY